jgi:predicted metalloendopeptidase
MYINTQHPFYTKLYSKLSNELKFKLAQFISCHEIAQQQVHYYSDETVKEIIDWYNTYLANEVGKSLGL